MALKKAEFMEKHLGEEFPGTVSGVTTFGIFVLLDEYFVDGLVHVNSLMDDYYRLREEQYALVGERTGRRFRLGDSAPGEGEPGRPPGAEDRLRTCPGTRPR